MIKIHDGWPHLIKDRRKTHYHISKIVNIFPNGLISPKWLNLNESEKFGDIIVDMLHRIDWNFRANLMNLQSLSHQFSKISPFKGLN